MSCCLRPPLQLEWKRKKNKNMYSVEAWRVFSTSSHLLWLKVCILTPWCVYFCRIFLVSSSVLKEFMRTRGTSVLYVLFRCCRKKDARCGQTAHETSKPLIPGGQKVWVSSIISSIVTSMSLHDRQERTRVEFWRNMQMRRRGGGNYSVTS